MRFVLVLMLAGAWSAAQERPAGMGLSTWVREEIFAGFLAGEMPQFEKGMKKLSDVLAADPASPDALAWRGGGKLLLAVRAHEAGDAAGFQKHFADAQADFAKGAAEAARQPDFLAAVHAICGGSYTVFSDRLPAGQRKFGWTQVRDSYLALRETQKAFFDKMPLHMRGEVLAGLAQASQRIGDADAQARLTDLIETLPGSVYATRARKWQEQPEVAARTALACQTCHDAGRLEPTLQRMAAQKK